MSTASILLQRARATTSLEDFGEDSFREGLEILVASAEAEARLTKNGRAAFEMQMVEHLSKLVQDIVPFAS